MTLTVLYNECPKADDGRVGHYFVKKGNNFVCAGCGEPSNPAQRWQPKPSRQVG